MTTKINTLKKLKLDLIEKPAIVFSNYDDLKNPYYGGGGAYVIHELAKRLSNDFDITVVTGKYPGSKNESIDGVQYERIGIKSGSPKLGQLIYYFMLFYYFKFKRFDIWLESFTPPFSTNFLQLFTNKPVIGLAYMLVGEDMKRKYKIPFDLVERLGIKTYKYFIAPTDSVKNTIQRINPQAIIQKIPNGINFEEFKIQKKRTKKHILYLGRIEINQKGLDLLLEAYRLVHTVIKYDLYIAGSGTHQDLRRLKKLVIKLGLGNKVKLLGRVEGQTKDTLFQNSVLTVIPSRFETFSISSLESLSFGVPIISFDIEGLNWIPDNSSIKIKCFDTKDFANSMLMLSKNSKLRKKMGFAGLRYARANTWDEIVKVYIKYLMLVAKKKKC